MVSDAKVTASNSRLAILPYEKAAIRQEEMPDGLRCPDQLLFLSLRSLYAQLSAGVIDRPTGVAEKRKLLDAYRIHQFQWDLGDAWVRRIKDSELARANYRKNRTLENADKLLSAIEGGGCG